MRVFVTGGSGFVGSHLIEGLVKRGIEVHALARSEKSAEAVKRWGATPVRAELGDLRAEAIAGTDVVVHAAAFAEEWGTRAQFWEANVEGTSKLLAAAREAGVKRFIHIGTEAALFDGHDLIDVDETAPYPAHQRYLYSESKAESERRALAASSESFTTLSIRPRLVWGPRDASVLPAVLRMAKEGSFAWLDQGRARSSHTNVENLVHAIALAVTAPDASRLAGRAFFVADEGVHTVRDLLTALARTQGVDLGRRSMPSMIARPLAWLVEGLWRLFGVKRAPPMTRFGVDMMSSTVTVRTDRAREELGYAPVVTFEEGLAKMTTKT
jgi:nucleoside-diphosphate-sugar epimerase